MLRNIVFVDGIQDIARVAAPQEEHIGPLLNRKVLRQAGGWRVSNGVEKMSKGPGQGMRHSEEESRLGYNRRRLVLHLSPVRNSTYTWRPLFARRQFDVLVMFYADTRHSFATCACSVPTASDPGIQSMSEGMSGRSGYHDVHIRMILCPPGAPCIHKKSIDRLKRVKRPTGCIDNIHTMYYVKYVRTTDPASSCRYTKTSEGIDISNSRGERFLDVRLLLTRPDTRTSAWSVAVMCNKGKRLAVSPHEEGKFARGARFESSAWET